MNEFPREPWRATLDLRFERRALSTALVHNSHSGPIRVQKALYPEGAHCAHALLVHPPAGIASGDELSINVRAAAQAQVQLTTPGAGKWYQSFGAAGVMHSSGSSAESDWMSCATTQPGDVGSRSKLRAELANVIYSRKI